MIDGSQSQFTRTSDDSALLPIAANGDLIRSSDWNRLLHSVVRIQKGGHVANDVTRSLQITNTASSASIAVLNYPLYIVSSVTETSGIIPSGTVQSMLGGQIPLSRIFNSNSLFLYSCSYLYTSSVPLSRTLIPFTLRVIPDYANQQIEYWLRCSLLNEYYLTTGTYLISIVVICP